MCGDSVGYGRIDVLFNRLDGGGLVMVPLATPANPPSQAHAVEPTFAPRECRLDSSSSSRTEQKFLAFD